MLQFNTALCTITSRCTSRLLWRINLSFSTNSTIGAIKPANIVESNHQKPATASNTPTNYNQHVEFNNLKKNLGNNFKEEPAVFTRIQNAQDINDLLQVINTTVSNDNKLTKIKKVMATWISVNDKLTLINKAKTSHSDVAKVQSTDFENSESDMNINLENYRDFSTAQMIKEIKKLTDKKNRNIQLLNYFYQNILEHNATLKLQQCSCLLYSMSVLNYSDERLLHKICLNLVQLNQIYTATLTSILRSMATIRYKNSMFLKYLCNNINSKFDTIKKNDEIVSVLLSLATLGYYSEVVDKIIKQSKAKLTSTSIKSTDWLNFVWSLIIFKKAESSDVESVLCKAFITKLMSHDSKIALSHQLKLLNINAYAQYAMLDYKGPFLDYSIVPYVTSKRSKQKELHVNLLKETLKNMLPSSSHFKMNINTNMGFLLDAEFHIDSNFNAVDINTDKNMNLTKIGILIVDYYETCLGEEDYQGLIKLYNYLLTCSNYKVVCIPYQHFGLEDKLEKHVSYLKRKLWKTVKEI